MTETERAEMEQTLAEWSLASEESQKAYVDRLTKTPQRISSGVAELDEAIGGGFPIGMTIVGGVPGAGKTTLMCQAMVEMASRGETVVFLSYDMSKVEITSKLVCYLGYMKFGAESLSLSKISKGDFADNPQIQEIFKDMTTKLKRCTIFDMLDYEDLGERLGDGVVNDNRAEWYLRTIILLYTNMYQAPLFIIDNLQQVVGALGYEGKAGVDKVVNLLKEMSRERGAPIILISTINRASYKSPLTMQSFKESGNIEFAADCALGLEAKYITDGNDTVKEEDFKASASRDITVKCLKSRDSSCNMSFVTLDAKFCTFGPYDSEKPQTGSIPSPPSRDGYTLCG